MSDNVETTKSNAGFMEHMTKMDDESKSLLMNMTQYAVLSTIPILALNYVTEIVFPEHEESKGNFELVVEILGELVFTLICLFFINRLVTFVPTYSGTPLTSVNFMTIALLFVLSQVTGNSSELGKKLNALAKRIQQLWGGEEEEKSKKENVSVTRPITGLTQPIPTHQTSRADYINTQQSVTPPLLPTNEATSQANYGGPTISQQVEQQQMGSFEPMAANGVLGGSFGSSF
tara:strand:+ start:974 stop:1669 length:696 start_codon:yes stop_codon:yes gene_type:complete